MVIADLIGDQETARLLLFGRGLIGQGVLAALAPRLRSAQVFPFEWDEPAQQVQQLDSLGSALRQGWEEKGGSIRLLWSAGRAGFGSSKVACRREEEAFGRVLDWFESSFPSARCTLHFLSSAGGLFEGQVDVGRETEVNPLRPYGKAKANQEALIHDSMLRNWRIYRPSSVFGFPTSGVRRGLIPVMLENGLRGQVTHISGSMSTLRDFIWVGDVARFIARDLTKPVDGQSTEFLVSGHSTPLLYSKRLCEQALGRRLYVTFSTSPTNAATVHFNPTVRPTDWHPQPLQPAIHAIKNRLLRGVAASTSGLA